MVKIFSPEVSVTEVSTEMVPFVIFKIVTLSVPDLKMEVYDTIYTRTSLIVGSLCETQWDFPKGSF